PLVPVASHRVALAFFFPPRSSPPRPTTIVPITGIPTFPVKDNPRVERLEQGGHSTPSPTHAAAMRRVVRCPPRKPTPGMEPAVASSGPTVMAPCGQLGAASRRLGASAAGA